MLHLIPFSPSNFGRYVSQTEVCIDEPIGANEWTQASLSAINDIPSLMSIPTIPSSSDATNVPLKNAAIFSSAVTKEIEPSPFLHHGPGPIQRPTKLTCPSTQSSNVANSIQSPGTSDVLDQINHFLYDHNTSTTGTSTPHANHVSAMSPAINDLTTPNISWTTFSPAEWPAKSDSSWPLATLQSPAIPLAAHAQNPFAPIPTINEYQRQTSRGESPVWSSALGTATPRFASPSTRTQRASTWNDIFSSTVPSSTESTKPTSNSWLKFLSAPDPSATDDVCLSGQESRPINPFWNLSSLSNESVAPSSTQVQQQTTSSNWWPTSSSDENNNTNQLNQSTDDTAPTRDQSRWDFAR